MLESYLISLMWLKNTVKLLIQLEFLNLKLRIKNIKNILKEQNIFNQENLRENDKQPLEKLLSINGNFSIGYILKDSLKQL